MSDWTECVLVQRDIARYWTTPEAAEYLGGMLKSMIARDDIDESDAETWGSRLLRLEPDRVGLATPIWVSPDMMSVTEVAAKEFPEWPLEGVDVPEAQGFVLFPRSFLFVDRMGVRLSLRAISWSPLVKGQGEYRGTGDPPMDDILGLFLTLYTDRDEVDDESLTKKDRAMLPRWLMVHFTPWVFGKVALSAEAVNVLGDQYEGPNIDPAIAALLQSLFALMRQEIGVTSYGTQYPRFIRRPFERQRLQIPTTRVITLRKRHKVDRDREDGEVAAVEWTHRWMVSGHWHTYNTKSGPILKWLLPYMKGPEDKPLVVKKSILRLTR